MKSKFWKKISVISMTLYYNIKVHFETENYKEILKALQKTYNSDH